MILPLETDALAASVKEAGALKTAPDVDPYLEGLVTKRSSYPEALAKVGL